MFEITKLLLFGLVGFGLLSVSADAQTKDQTKPKTEKRTKNVVSKKGIAITTKNANQKKWHSKIKSLNVSWHYNWAARIKESEPDGVEFVPMMFGFWGASPEFKNTIKELTLDQKNGKRQHLLGPNEPDHKKQSNMSVEKAFKVWPYLEKTGLRLGSPATVHADQEWMQEFMQRAKEKKHRVDFVTVHWYGNPNADTFINHLKKIHKMYGKPIWITEFAVADWNAKSLEENKFSPHKVHRFMKEVLPRLDKLDFVERYAWFSTPQKSATLGNSALFKPDGSLTWLGKLYAAHNKNRTAPSPEKAKTANRSKRLK